MRHNFMASATSTFRIPCIKIHRLFVEIVTVFGAEVVHMSIRLQMAFNYSAILTGIKAVMFCPC